MSPDLVRLHFELYEKNRKRKLKIVLKEKKSIKKEVKKLG